jgi:hypothetical protein
VRIAPVRRSGEAFAEDRTTPPAGVEPESAVFEAAEAAVAGTGVEVVLGVVDAVVMDPCSGNFDPVT